MADAVTIHKIIGRIGNDPGVLVELMSQADDNGRHGVLQKHGLVAAGQHGPTKDEIQREIAALLGSVKGAAPAGAGGQTVVAWVGAIGTAVAGAAAGACTSD